VRRRVGRRIGRRRRVARGAVAGIAVDPLGARARPRSPGRRPRPPRRAVERVLRRRGGEGERPSGDRRVHERDGDGGAPPRRRGGVAGSRPARAAHRGPATPRARHGCEPDDRAARPVRWLRPGGVRSPGPHDGRPGGMVATGRAGGPRGDGRRPDRTCPPELPVRGAAHTIVGGHVARPRRGGVRVAPASAGRARPRRVRASGSARVGRSRRHRGRRTPPVHRPAERAAVVRTPRVAGARRADLRGTHAGGGCARRGTGGDRERVGARPTARGRDPGRRHADDASHPGLRGVGGATRRRRPVVPRPRSRAVSPSRGGRPGRRSRSSGPAGPIRRRRTGPPTGGPRTSGRGPRSTS
jgi:hypothetical protein